MESAFSFYDIVAHIIPGTLVLWALYYTLTVMNLSVPIRVGGDATAVAVFLVIAYVLGSLLRAISSRYDQALWESYGGLPSIVFLSEKSKYSKSLREGILNALKEQFPEVGVSSGNEVSKIQELFDLAYELVVDQKVSDRPMTFNSLFGFFHGLTIALPICSAILAANAIWQVVRILAAQAPVSSLIMPIFLAMIFLAGRQVSEEVAVRRGKSFADSVYKSFYIWHKHSGKKCADR